LTRAVGLSRPAFARHCSSRLGRSPMRYLTERRMQEAAALLLGSDAALAEVARRVGYVSEFAFNRAFKKHHGVPPGVYRRGPLAAPACSRVVGALALEALPAPSPLGIASGTRPLALAA